MDADEDEDEDEYLCSCPPAVRQLHFTTSLASGENVDSLMLEKRCNAD